MKKQKQHDDMDRLFAAISYLWILFVIPFVLGHNKPFVYKHAKQGMVLFLVGFVLLAIGWFPLFWPLSIAGWLFVVVCSVIGIAYALSNQEFTVPLFGKMVKK